MLKTFKDAFIILRDNQMIVQPFILYILVTSYTTRTLFYAGGNPVLYSVSALSAFLLTAAFLSGWFFMAKSAVQEFVQPKTEEAEAAEEAVRKPDAGFSILKQFFPGVGEYFLSISAALFIYFVLFVVAIIAALKLGNLFLANPNISFAQIQALTVSAESAKKVVSALSDSQILLINKWSLYLFLVSTVYNFVTMLFFAAIFYESKNPFVAFFKSIVVLLKNFFSVFVIFAFLSIANIGISLLSMVAGNNVILGVIGLLFAVYYAGFYAVLIFLYYERIKQKNTSNRGCDLIG